MEERFMQGEAWITFTLWLAMSSLVGCSQPNVSADTASTANIPAITETVEQAEPTPTEVYVDSLISATITPTIAPTATAESASTTVVMPTVKADAKTTVTKTATKKTVAEKSGIKKVSGTKYANASVNVRKDATADSKKLGTLKTNTKVTITGKVNNGWYRIKYKDGVGYVKATYLSDTKTKVKSDSSNSSSSNNNSSSGNNSNSGGESSIPNVKGNIAGDDDVPDSGDPTDPWK
jgi:hypothetical protein